MLWLEVGGGPGAPSPEAHAALVSAAGQRAPGARGTWESRLDAGWGGGGQGRCPWNVPAAIQCCGCLVMGEGARAGRGPRRLLAAEQRAQQKHAGHRGPGQEPLVETLLAPPALGCSVIAIEIHEPLLQ